MSSSALLTQSLHFPGVARRIQAPADANHRQARLQLPGKLGHCNTEPARGPNDRPQRMVRIGLRAGERRGHRRAPNWAVGHDRRKACAELIHRASACESHPHSRCCVENHGGRRTSRTTCLVGIVTCIPIITFRTRLAASPRGKPF
jgi:hypothetical protein